MRLAINILECLCLLLPGQRCQRSCPEAQNSICCTVSRNQLPDMLEREVWSTHLPCWIFKSVFDEITAQRFFQRHLKCINKLDWACKRSLWTWISSMPRGWLGWILFRLMLRFKRKMDPKQSTVYTPTSHPQQVLGLQKSVRLWGNSTTLNTQKLMLHSRRPLFH